MLRAQRATPEPQSLFKQRDRLCGAARTVVINGEIVDRQSNRSKDACSAQEARYRSFLAL